MPNTVFVGREPELAKLNTLLETAAQGKAQVVFIVGEAGAGKLSLVTEFVRRVEEADPKLLTARTIVDGIANSITREDLREIFLRSTEGNAVPT